MILNYMILCCIFVCSLGSKDMLPLAVLQKAMGTGPYLKYSPNGNSKVTQAAAQVTSSPFAVSIHTSGVDCGQV